MDYVFATILFISIALTAWRIGSLVAYMLAGFIGVGELLYMMVNGFDAEVGYALAGTAALVLVGFLRDRQLPQSK